MTWNFQSGPVGPISMEVYDTLHMLENLGYVDIRGNGGAAVADEIEARWYLDQQDAEPDAYTADAIQEELRVHLTEKGRIHLRGIVNRLESNSAERILLDIAESERRWRSRFKWWNPTTWRKR